MPEDQTPSAPGADTDAGPADSGDDPFDDEAVTSILDAAWDDI